MKGLMFGGVMVMGIAMAVGGGLQLGSLGEPPFAYESATHEARTAFLEGEAETMGKIAKRALINPSGVGGSIRLAKTEVNAGRRNIRIELAVSGYGQVNHAAFRKLGKAMQEGLCPRYKRSRLSNHNVNVDYVFMEKGKYRISKVTLNTGICQQHA